MTRINPEVRTYLLVFAVLLVLAVATVAFAYVDLGILNPVVAVLIAIAKASLIMLFFMHLRHSPKVTWVFALLSVLWLMILLVITMSDYIARYPIRVLN